MDEPVRRAWSRPELIVLVRSKPEEAVLGTCKQSDDLSVAGPRGVVNTSCTGTNHDTDCDPCSTPIIS